MTAEIESLRNEIANMRARETRTEHGPMADVSGDRNLGNGDQEPRAQSKAQGSISPSAGGEEGEAAGYNPVDSLHMNDSGQISYMGPTSIPLSDLPARSIEHNYDFSSLLPSSFPSSQPDSYFSLNTSAHNDLLDLYFKYLNGWTGFVDEIGFRTALDDPTHANHAYTPFSHVCILASASHISDNIEFRSIAPGERSVRFVNAALQMLGREIECPNPCTINAVVQLGLNAFDSGKSSTGWTLAGLYIRISQGLGLGVNTSKLVEQGKMDTLSRRAREDGFWTAYVDDTLTSLYSGRLPSKELEDHDIPLPDASPGPIEDCTGTHPIMELALVTICAIARRVMHWFYSIRKERPRYADKVQVMRSDLEAWGKRFDPRAADPPRSPTSPSAMQHQMRRAPVTNSQACKNLHVAGSFFILLLADLYDQPDKLVQRRQAEEGLDHVVSYLNLLAGSWAIASQALEAIQKMRHEYAVNTDLVDTQNNLRRNALAEDIRLTFDIEEFLRGDLGLNLVDLGVFSGDPDLSIIDELG
ncbi:hypothetical protein L486_07156 [Kwoniella mangroviensis CBS 10435]|uniref:Xylanolytic transcriptional activator regulatory domain-containing protein n=1 Tax=Kwoniella mangroviensis CBS 10435 TaxID=1331196 RepID=A0A1B9IHE4_9TREE|nr:hypothetical protein L486_07156 [Kwoniella mangroviensis CBS 10435]